MTLPDQKTANIGSRTLSWREKGSGTALVLIHGTGGSAASWSAQFDRFPDRYRVIAWDAPGYGASDPWGDTPPTADDYARLLGRFLDSRGVATAHIVGHSVGAILAGGLCRLKSTMVMSATFLHPLAGFAGLEPDDRDRQRASRLNGVETLGMAAFVEQWAPSVLSPAAETGVHDTVQAIMREISEDAYRHMTDVIVSGDLLAQAGKIRAPSLVISGRDDRIATEESCRIIAEALPTSEIVSLEGIGHYLPIEDPALFHRTLDAFLADKIDVSTYF